METATQVIPLRTFPVQRDHNHDRTAPPSQELPSEETPPLLPPISHKKQAAVLASAFVAIALTIGYNQCFGVWQEYYLSPDQDVLILSSSHQTPFSPEDGARGSVDEQKPPTALLAFVGTLCYGLTWAGGILVNPVISRIEHGIWAPDTNTTRSGRGRGKTWRRRWGGVLLTNRTITVTGVFLMALGFALASFATTVWHLLLTQGFLVGLGMSLVYFPLLAPAPEYFSRHRGTAMGFVCPSF